MSAGASACTIMSSRDLLLRAAHDHDTLDEDHDPCLAHDFSPADPEDIYWVKGCPLFLHEKVGQGGFGNVYRVEVLVPVGENSPVSSSSIVYKSRGEKTEKRLRVSGVKPSDIYDDDLDFHDACEDFPLSGGTPEDADCHCTNSPGNHDPLQSAPIGSDKRCRLRGSGNFFALKISTAFDKRQYVEFCEEVRALSDFVSNEKVVQLCDYAFLPDLCQVVMLTELAVCDLSQFLKWQEYEVQMEDLGRIFLSLVQCVAELHAKDVVHRDLKPHNFLLVPVSSDSARSSEEERNRVLRVVAAATENYGFRVCRGGPDESAEIELMIKDPKDGTLLRQRLAIKVADLGLARSVGKTSLEMHQQHPLCPSSSSSGTTTNPLRLQGTAEFCAPEMLIGPNRNGMSTAADVWALGAVLFQVLHKGPTPFGALLQQRREKLLPAARREVLTQTLDREKLLRGGLRCTKPVFAAERAKVLRCYKLGPGETTEGSVRGSPHLRRTLPGRRARVVDPDSRRSPPAATTGQHDGRADDTRLGSGRHRTTGRAPRLSDEEGEHPSPTRTRTDCSRDSRSLLRRTTPPIGQHAADVPWADVCTDLVLSWLRVELLRHVAGRCLAFEAIDRPSVGEISCWMERGLCELASPNMLSRIRARVLGDNAECETFSLSEGRISALGKGLGRQVLGGLQLFKGGKGEQEEEGASAVLFPPPRNPPPRNPSAVVGSAVGSSAAGTEGFAAGKEGGDSLPKTDSGAEPEGEMSPTRSTPPRRGHQMISEMISPSMRKA